MTSRPSHGYDQQKQILLIEGELLENQIQIQTIDYEFRINHLNDVIRELQRQKQILEREVREKQEREETQFGSPRQDGTNHSQINDNTFDIYSNQSPYEHLEMSGHSVTYPLQTQTNRTYNYYQTPTRHYYYHN